MMKEKQRALIACCVVLFIITNGFVKKTQKTPPEEIRLAKTRREDYIHRKREENEKSKTV